MNDEKIINFCRSVNKGFGSIVDNVVKAEYERIYECKIEVKELARLLATLEKNDLLDKKRCVNSTQNFYQEMYKKINN